VAAKSATRSIADLLWDFDQDLACGNVLGWEGYLEQCRSSAQSTVLLRAMISAEIDRVGWDAERVKNRVRFCSKYARSKAAGMNLVRGVYSDQVEAGKRPLLSEFESLGYPINRLQLCVEGEGVFLGQVIAERYRVEQRMAKGSFGVIYRAQDLIADQMVAVKIAFGLDEEAKRKARGLLKREVAALRALRHPGIPRLVGVIDEAGGEAYMVQEFVHGQTLRDVCRGGPLEPRRAATIVAVLAETLHFIHCRGFTHRDLSPTNVLINETDRPYLLDFGLCLSETGDVQRQSEVGGTRNYMPLESVLGLLAGVDGRADIWALGALFYELLTGKHLNEFGRESDPEREHLWDAGHLFSSVALEELSREYSEDIPAAMQAICSKCLTLDPVYRFCTAKSLALELRQLLQNVPEDCPDPRIESAEAHLRAWRIGVQLGSVFNWHCYSNSLLRQIAKKPNGTPEALYWVVVHALGQKVVSSAYESQVARCRDERARELKARKHSTPEFQALQAEAGVLGKRLNAGEQLEDHETTRLNQYINAIVDFSNDEVEEVSLQLVEALQRGMDLLLRVVGRRKITRHDVEWVQTFVDDVKRRVGTAHAELSSLAVWFTERVRMLIDCAQCAADCCVAITAEESPRLRSLATALGLQTQAEQFMRAFLPHRSDPIALYRELQRFYRAVDQYLLNEIPYDVGQSEAL
jgi:serine/threonine protein kinase